MDSGELSRKIYYNLGPAGLARRTTTQWDAVTVERLDRLLRADGCRRVLDAGCGYGRIAIPLAERGYDLTGIDITPCMLAAAQEQEAARLGAAAKIRWELGDLRKLPCDANSFDAALCMWLTFNELLEHDEQLKTLQELQRVIRPGGWALIDGPPYMDSDTEPEAAMGSRQTTDATECFARVDPVQSRTGQRYLELARDASIEAFELTVDDCPGRQRYFFRFWKQQKETP